jgi:hypothetical protein
MEEQLPVVQGVSAAGGNVHFLYRRGLSASGYNAGDGLIVAGKVQQWLLLREIVRRALELAIKQAGNAVTVELSQIRRNVGMIVRAELPTRRDTDRRPWLYT